MTKKPRPAAPADKPRAASRPGAEPTRPARPCPICGRMSVAEFHPFCSKRCADIDLHRWLGGRYAIPGEPVTDEEPPEKG